MASSSISATPIRFAVASWLTKWGTEKRRRFWLSSPAAKMGTEIHWKRAEKLGVPEHDEGAFFEALETTLIMVPSHLVDQWAAEAEKFAKSYKLEILTIKTVTHLANETPETLAEYDLIICTYAVLYSEKFRLRVGDFLSSDPDRAWYKSRENVKRNEAYKLQELKRVTQKFIETWDNGEIEERDNYIDSPIFKESEALSSAIVKEHCNRKALKNKKHKSIQVPFPLLEQMFFGRVVLDEFHEAECFKGRTHCLMWLRGLTRWGLTGTPHVGSAQSVKIMAGLFSIDVVCNGVDAAWAQPQGPVERKPFQKIIPHANDDNSDNPNFVLRSPCVSKTILDNCQNFINVMVRQNSRNPDVDSIEIVPHSIPVDFTEGERILYDATKRNYEYSGPLGEAEKSDLIRRCSHYAPSSNETIGDELKRKAADAKDVVGDLIKTVKQLLAQADAFRAVLVVAGGPESRKALECPGTRSYSCSIGVQAQDDDGEEMSENATKRKSSQKTAMKKAAQKRAGAARQVYGIFFCSDGR
ncbi:unnamed protein product [Amoebophrya sp. A25]|nr:unnamed protein product [Amoebophrya sp. A25]|eukprot:GSA25T00013905001.1